MGLADRDRRRSSTDVGRDDPEVVHDVRDDRRDDRTVRDDRDVRDDHTRDDHTRDDHTRDDRHRDDRAVRDDRTAARHLDEPAVVPAHRSSAAVVALVLGVIAVLLAVVPIVGVIGSLLGIIAIVSGIIGMFAARKVNVTGGGMALAGIILGVLSLILAGAGIALFGDTAADLQAPVEDAIEDVQQQVEDATN